MMDANTSNRLMLESLVMSASKLGYDRELMERIMDLERDINMLEVLEQTVDGVRSDVFVGINNLCDAINLRTRKI